VQVIGVGRIEQAMIYDSVPVARQHYGKPSRAGVEGVGAAPSGKSMPDQDDGKFPSWTRLAVETATPAGAGVTHSDDRRCLRSA
jgi:hypothetical protein